jgi:hypothetical protein
MPKQIGMMAMPFLCVVALRIEGIDLPLQLVEVVAS